MNENINLCEILKYCPEGTEFWSPLFNKVIFCGFRDDFQYPIGVCLSDNSLEAFMSNGYFSEDNDECLLFPSKEQRDWSKWVCQKPKKPRFDAKTLQPFDKVLVTSEEHTWTCTFVSHVEKDAVRVYLTTLGYVYYAIPYNDETKHLLGTREEAPEYYRYWED